VFEILEECQPAQCIEQEQYWLDAIKPDYNICKIAGSTLGYQHSLDTKTKIGDWERNAEYRNKLSWSLRGNKSKLGQKPSSETKNKIRASCKLNAKPQRGEKHGCAKLTISDVSAIRVMLQQGVKQNIIATTFGVKQPAISSIKTGRRWK